MNKLTTTLAGLAFVAAASVAPAFAQGNFFTIGPITFSFTPANSFTVSSIPVTFNPEFCGAANTTFINNTTGASVVQQPEV